MTDKPEMLSRGDPHGSGQRSPPEPTSELGLQAWLAEFQQLRGEIDNRSQLQGTLVGLNVIAFGLVGGLAAGETIGAGGLLGLALGSPLFGLMYLNHDESIHRIGDYIRDRIQPKVAAITGDPQVLGWEGSGERIPKSRPELIQNVAIALFLLPALFGLVSGLVEIVTDPEAPIIVGFPIALVAVSIYLNRLYAARMRRG